MWQDKDYFPYGKDAGRTRPEGIGGFSFKLGQPNPYELNHSINE
jgi:hypothetical protein